MAFFVLRKPILQMHMCSHPSGGTRCVDVWCLVRPFVYFHTWAPSSEFVSSSIPSWHILTAHAQPFRGARDLAFCLKVPLDSLLVWASSGGSGETARMRRLAWTFAARIGDKYQIRLTRSTSCVWTVMALARLRECTGLPEPSLVAYVISTKISFAGSFVFSNIFLFLSWPNCQRDLCWTVKQLMKLIYFFKEKKIKIFYQQIICL